MSDPQQDTEIWERRDLAAQYHGISRDVLRQWIKRGHVKAKRTASHWWVDLVSMERYVSQRQERKVG